MLKCKDKCNFLSPEQSEEQRRKQKGQHLHCCSLWLIYFQIYKWLLRNECLIANIYYLLYITHLKHGGRECKGSDMQILQNWWHPLAEFHGVCSDRDLKASLVHSTVDVLKHHFIIEMLCFLCGPFSRIMGKALRAISSLRLKLCGCQRG